MVKKREMAAFHRERILRAATALFAQKGLENTTVDEIARQADYSKATLYVYFRSKEEIYRSIQRDAMARMEGEMERIASKEENPLRQYWLICESIAVYAKGEPFALASMLETIPWDEKSRQASPLLEEIYQIGERSIGHIQRMVERGTAQGLFREEIAGQPVGMLYWGMLSGR